MEITLLFECWVEELLFVKTYNVYKRKAFNPIWSSLADYVTGLNVCVRSDQQLTEASEPLDGLRRREDG